MHRGESSPFEQEVFAGLQGLKNWRRSHDRYVLIGLLTSLIPLPPASLVALAISVINLRLIRKDKLARAERPLIYFSIAMALIGLTAFSYFAFVVFAHRDEAIGFLRTMLERTTVRPLVTPEQDPYTHSI